MGNIFAELKRRHIYRVAAAYAVVAWIILQIVNNVAPAFSLPGSTVMLVIVLLSVGFPIALIFAWVLEMKAPGAPTKTGVMDGVLAMVAVAFIGMFAYQQLAPSRATVSSQAGVDAARAAAASPKGAISIAVLPFTNLSDDKQQGFFSDGMTEEITSALAKIPDLRVVARESAFQYKGAKNDMRTVGQALGATHLLEGSVRKDGDRVRIAAQLVKADDGVNIWADNYDRQLTDVFAIQEDIARAIAASLRMPLGIKPGENLINDRAVSPAAHESYLRAKNLVRERFPQPVAEAIKLLEETVAHEPNYAPAWGLLGSAYHFQLLSHPAVANGTIEEARRIVAETLAKGQAAAERAVKLDPKSVDGYAALAELQTDRGDWSAGLDLYQRVFALDPDQPEALQGYSINLAHLGYVKQALPIRDHLLAVEPFVPAYQGVTARLLFADGQTDAALALLMKNRTITLLPQIYASQGRMREAIDTMDALRAPDPTLQFMVETAVRLLRAGPTVTLPNDSPDLSILNWVYFYTGDPERYLSVFEREVKIGYTPGTANGIEWAPSYSSIRKTERFKAYVRNAGMVEYWKKNGWPDLCHPTTGDDFECN